MDVGVHRVETVEAPQLGGQGVSRLVAVAALKAHAGVDHPEVGMGVDKAGVDMLAGSVDHFGARRVQVFADGGDFAVFYKDIGGIGLLVDGVKDQAVFDNFFHFWFLSFCQSTTV